MEINVKAENYEQEVVNSEIPVLVDFWAVWCMPCTMVAPVIAQIAEQYAGRLKVCKVNVDEAPGLAEKNGVRGIPTIVLFKNGKEAGRVVGSMPKAQLEEFFKPFI